MAGQGAALLAKVKSVLPYARLIVIKGVSVLV
jgi:hypothetical protein